MAISEVGRQLAEIKARTGLTWAAIADTIGASSGDYVRKVAAGHRPGANLTRAVDELMSTGQVSRPVPRRTTSAGTVARVRAPRSSGAPSRRPAPTRVAATEGRSLFRGADGRLGWSQNVGRDRTEFNRALASAGRGGRRVTFRALVRLPNGQTRWVTVGQKGGYLPRRVPRRGDVVEWIRSQGGDRYLEAGGARIEEVEVIAE